jgi:hypothetical protein
MPQFYQNIDLKHESGCSCDACGCASKQVSNSQPVLSPKSTLKEKTEQPQHLQNISTQTLFENAVQSIAQPQNPYLTPNQPNSIGKSFIA